MSLKHIEVKFRAISDGSFYLLATELYVYICKEERSNKLEDLKVLRCSPDLFNNVKIGQGFMAYNKTYFVLPYMGVAAFLVK